jgi:hypothetical protein
MLRIVYAGHGIFKDKYFGVYRRDGKPLLSLEVRRTSKRKKLIIETDIKYMYGRTQFASEEMEFINAAHVFSDILAMSEESQLSISTDRNTPLHPSAREVIQLKVMLTIDIRCQCSAWTDPSILVQSSTGVHDTYQQIGSPTQIPENNSLSHSKIRHLHRFTRLLNGLCTRISPSHVIDVIKANFQIAMHIKQHNPQSQLAMQYQHK